MIQIASSAHGSVTVVAPRGRVDHRNADEFSGALAPYLDQCRPGHPLLLDFSGLEYISSAGLRILMLASKRAGVAGGKIAVAAPSSLVREVFEISRFDLVLPLHPSVTDGIAALSGKVAT